ncbi:acyl-CoA dehydrogenase family protein [Mycolicibacterium psychrotolerans]|uniref:Acyl-CoA dehydrogenase n=1 Tax=Mycolicibacterium psychrotolerans TaxID=216929 RepID=A0A7I7M8U6_9MYCO|nr:acyl-CoA dehydrogenase family protein [Mycolicibacterium psychrotolerans]BBX68446.1 acyl-CoA dehydrogenase [Mycolicibacterium psychrotolerans]
MTTSFADHHDDLRAVAARLLGRGAAPDWGALVDAGWTGLEVPEHLGGAGATFAETAIICEQIGRAAATTDFLGGAVLAAGVLTALPPTDARDHLLGAVAAGPARLAVAVGSFRLDGGVVSGRADFVPDALGADQILIPVTGGVAVVQSTDVTVTAQPVVDQTRRLATVTADGAPADTVLSASPGALHDRAAVAIACDSLGVAQEMLSRTVEFVKVRHQFGRPVGSFQAVKHACADMLVGIEVSRQLVAEAVTALAAGADGGVAAAMAKSHACSTAVAVAGKAMQLHGGIGYTWEAGIHTYLKRAALNRSLFGSTAAQRRRIAQRYPKGT